MNVDDALGISEPLWSARALFILGTSDVQSNKVNAVPQIGPGTLARMVRVYVSVQIKL